MQNQKWLYDCQREPVIVDMLVLVTYILSKNFAHVEMPAVDG